MCADKSIFFINIYMIPVIYLKVLSYWFNKKKKKEEESNH